MKMKTTCVIMFCMLVLTVSLAAEKKSSQNIAQPTSGISMGMIALYAGDLSIDANLKALNDSGWLLCDGGLYSSDDYPELFSAIANTNGGNSSGNFNVPDLRDRFIRGVSGASQKDPDSGSRIAANPGGATGNNAGSFQNIATALPQNAAILNNTGAHTHTINNINPDTHHAWNGSTDNVETGNISGNCTEAGAHSHSIGGYNSTTEPINMALYFIIKAKEPKTASGAIPGGGIMAFGGSTTNFQNTDWLFCNGMAYGFNLYPAMAAMISCNYGGDGVSVLNVPDFRGYFLRGTSHTTQRDPDAATRYQLSAGGNKGDKVGSAQSFATKIPASLVAQNTGDHCHNLDSIPQSGVDAAKGSNKNSFKEGTSDSETSSLNGDHIHSLIGGDKESRPTNLYFDYLIADKNLMEAPPIGTIIATGCDTTNANTVTTLQELGWFPCDGRLISKSNYNALYAVIENIYGTGSTSDFKLPDLRGYFVKGAGGNSDIGQVLSNSTTGIPNNPIITSTTSNHYHTFANLPSGNKDITKCAGWHLAKYNSSSTATSYSGAHTHTVTGGDSESRPVNVNVDYIIRYK